MHLHTFHPICIVAREMQRFSNEAGAIGNATNDVRLRFRFTFGVVFVLKPIVFTNRVFSLFHYISVVVCNTNFVRKIRQI